MSTSYQWRLISSWLDVTIHVYVTQSGSYRLPEPHCLYIMGPWWPMIVCLIVTHMHLVHQGISHTLLEVRICCKSTGCKLVFEVCSHRNTPYSLMLIATMFKGNDITFALASALACAPAFNSHTHKKVRATVSLRTMFIGEVHTSCKGRASMSARMAIHGPGWPPLRNPTTPKTKHNMYHRRINVLRNQN